MGTFRKCFILCWWSAVLLTARGAPTGQSNYLRSKDSMDIESSYKMHSGRKQRDLTPCFSTLKGYGLCDDYLFTLNSPYDYKQNLAYGSPEYTEQVTTQYQQPPSTVHNEFYRNPPTYQNAYTDIYTTSYQPTAYPNINPQTVVADQYVVIISPTTKDPKDTSKYQQYPTLSSRTTASQSIEVAPSNVEEVHSELETIFQKMIDISRNVEKALMEGGDLQRKINRTRGLPTYGSNKIISYIDYFNNLFRRIEKLAEKILNVTSSLIEFQRKSDSKVLDSNKKTPETGKYTPKSSFQEETDLKSYDEPAKEAIAPVKNIDNLSNGDPFDRIPAKIDKLDNDVISLSLVVHSLGNYLTKSSESKQTLSNWPGDPTFAEVLKKTADIAEKLENIFEFIDEVRKDIQNGVEKILQDRDEMNLTIRDTTSSQEDITKDQMNLTVSDQTSSQDIPENLSKRDLNHARDPKLPIAAYIGKIMLEESRDLETVQAVLDSFEKLLLEIYGIKFLSELEANKLKSIFMKGIKKGEVEGNVIKVRKNTMYDFMEQAYKSNTFDEFILGTYVNKTSELVSSGVEPFEIFEDSLSNFLILVSQGIQDIKNEKLRIKMDNNELYELIRNVIQQKSSETSLNAYFKKLDDIQSTGVDSGRLTADILGDIASVVYREMQEKDRRDIYNIEKDNIISIATRLFMQSAKRIIV